MINYHATSNKIWSKILCGMFGLFLLTGCSFPFETETNPRDEYLTDKGVSLTGLGSEESPYLIHNPQDFNQIKNNPKAHYKLTNDIDFSTDPYKEQDGLFYFGFETVVLFMGQLDGDGYSLIYSGDIHQPIFYQIENATVKNLDIQFDVSNIVDSRDVYCFLGYTYHYGVLAGINQSSLIQNIKFDLTINIRQPFSRSKPFLRAMGGLVGRNFGVIEHVSGNIDFSFTSNESNSYSHVHVGGIAGDNYGTVRYVSGTQRMDISTRSSVYELRAGGIVGNNYGVIDGVYSTTNVSANSNKNDAMEDGVAVVGGIAGFNSGFGHIGNVKNSNQSISGVSASYVFVGGIAGDNNGEIHSTFSSGEYTAVGNITSLVSRPSVGSITGFGGFEKVSYNLSFITSTDEIGLFGMPGDGYQNVLFNNHVEYQDFLDNMIENEFFVHSESRWNHEEFIPLFPDDFWIFDNENEQYNLTFGGNDNV